MTSNRWRLRRGEQLAGASALLALVSMFALKWFRPAGAPRSVNGWSALTHLRWLMLVTILAALALVFLQATRRSPAVPVTMSVAVTILGTITFVWLGYRVVISPPPHEQVGAFLGLIGTFGIACGGYVSMREEGSWDEDQRMDIPIVHLRGESGS